MTLTPRASGAGRGSSKRRMVSLSFWYFGQADGERGWCYVLRMTQKMRVGPCIPVEVQRVLRVSYKISWANFNSLL